MKPRYLKYLERTDIGRVMRETASLLRMELRQTFDACRAPTAPGKAENNGQTTEDIFQTTKERGYF